MRTDDEKEADLALLKKHVEQLGEHYDCVQIFCSRHMPAEADGTVSVNWGSGNWFARFGQVREWMVYEDGKIKAHATNVTNEQ